MEIKTATNKIINTDKLDDVHAEIVEAVETSSVRELTNKYKGAYFIWSYISPQRGWSTFNVQDKQQMDALLSQVNFVLGRLTEGKFKLAVIPTD